MPYRITYTTADGTTRVMTSDPDDALKFAKQTVEQGRTNVWIADDSGRLFTPEDFEAFLKER